uniref:ImmA/IrrE family metallo-endopeptidase n=1 Tax=Anaerostipes caccae TaxID=105841 RepID=UPI003AB21698
MALTAEMKQLINEMANEVIRQYNITIPITNIDEVVRRMNGSIQENSAIDGFSDGRIRKDGSSSFVIEVSPFQTVERRNFTVAHEIGHLFLHMGFMTNESRWNSQKNITYYRNGNLESEYQSNEFAAAFLMPEDEYERIMDKNTEGNLVNTLEIARYFHVSVDAAANRGKWLGFLKW